jgi:anti-sigma regulatory factor (Ser/Thr protein kinase)
VDALVLPGNLDALDPIAQYVLKAAADAGLDQKASYRLRLAVDELATNQVVHGYEESNTSGDLTVRASLDDSALRITLEDTAPAFDPRTRLDPDHINKPLDERPIGGLGIFLVMRSVDEFHYEYVDNRNRYVLTMKRPAG